MGKGCFALIDLEKEMCFFVAGGIASAEATRGQRKQTKSAVASLIPSARILPCFLVFIVAGGRACGRARGQRKQTKSAIAPLTPSVATLILLGYCFFFEPKVRWINTRALYAVVTNSIARMGVQRVEDPLVGSRGSAPCASLIQTALCGQHTLNLIVDACRVSQRQSQRLIQRLQLVVVVFTVQHLQMQR